MPPVDLTDYPLWPSLPTTTLWPKNKVEETVPTQAQVTPAIRTNWIPVNLQYPLGYQKLHLPAYSYSCNRTPAAIAPAPCPHLLWITQTVSL